MPKIKVYVSQDVSVAGDEKRESTDLRADLQLRSDGQDTTTSERYVLRIQLARVSLRVWDKELFNDSIENTSRWIKK